MSIGRAHFQGLSWRGGGRSWPGAVLTAERSTFRGSPWSSTQWLWPSRLAFLEPQSLSTSEGLLFFLLVMFHITFWVLQAKYLPSHLWKDHLWLPDQQPGCPPQHHPRLHHNPPQPRPTQLLPLCSHRLLCSLHIHSIHVLDQCHGCQHLCQVWMHENLRLQIEVVVLGLLCPRSSCTPVPFSRCAGQLCPLWDTQVLNRKSNSGPCTIICHHIPLSLVTYIHTQLVDTSLQSKSGQGWAKHIVSLGLLGKTR